MVPRDQRFAVTLADGVDASEEEAAVAWIGQGAMVPLRRVQIAVVWSRSAKVGARHSSAIKEPCSVEGKILADLHVQAMARVSETGSMFGFRTEGASLNDRNTIDAETATDSALSLSALEWRFVGPYRGGRTMAVAGHPTARRTFYAGTSSGGVWRTEKAGTVWRNITDPYFKRASVGALAIADAEPSVIYVGMGECGLRSNVTHGDGVYRSTDGGESWLQVGLTETQNIGRIRIHSRDPTLVYVAAFGHRFGPNTERGVYRSRDAGRQWERVLFTNPETGAIDLSLDPQNPRVLYAAMWQARIFPWSHATTGPGSALFRSADGGDTWTGVSGRPGFPRGVKGRIGVTVSPVR